MRKYGAMAGATGKILSTKTNKEEMQRWIEHYNQMTSGFNVDKVILVDLTALKKKGAIIER